MCAGILTCCSSVLRLTNAGNQAFKASNNCCIIIWDEAQNAIPCRNCAKNKFYPFKFPLPDNIFWILSGTKIMISLIKITVTEKKIIPSFNLLHKMIIFRMSTHMLIFLCLLIAQFMSNFRTVSSLWSCRWMVFCEGTSFANNNECKSSFSTNEYLPKIDLSWRMLSHCWKCVYMSPATRSLTFPGASTLLLYFATEYEPSLLFHR